jgi:hypothetical protein
MFSQLIIVQETSTKNRGFSEETVFMLKEV